MLLSSETHLGGVWLFHVTLLKEIESHDTTTSLGRVSHGAETINMEPRIFP